jgi:hypothetical protein
MRWEPVINSAIIQALVTAVLGVVIAFGIPVAEDQKEAILTLTAVVCGIILGGGVVTRSTVTPVDKP